VWQLVFFRFVRNNLLFLFIFFIFDYKNNKIIHQKYKKMQINWEDIKSEILAEVKDVIQAETHININIGETLNLFIKVLLYPIDDSNLTGIETRLPNALQKIFFGNLSRIDKNSYFPDMAKIEPYFRKILYIIDNLTYQQIANNRDGLGTIIPILELNPNNINFSWTTLHPNQKTYFAEHLIKAYNLRNIESHNCKEWNNSKLYDELRSILVMYLFATHKHSQKLKLALQDLTDYLKKQIQS
jgi:hypothetical protein